ncbi:MAG TPA: helix-turn-helix domain-containing protein [Gaiellaceae bacterium]|nr:helix-turn-helix domain-containing protein [Gaiellaceae bacterium]
MAIIDRTPDYELDEVLLVEQVEQLRALAHPQRARIVTLLRERAASTTELAAALGAAKGTIAYHLKTLERAGLVRVVRTRRVRAVTERFYGRVARLFVLRSDDSLPEELRGGALGAMLLRQAAEELLAAAPDEDTSALVHARLPPAAARRFERRLNRLVADVQSAEDPEGERHALALAFFRSPVAPPARERRDA